MMSFFVCIKWEKQQKTARKIKHQICLFLARFEPLQAQKFRNLNIC